MAAGYGTSPFFVFSGYDVDGRVLPVRRAAVRRRCPAAPLGDGLDGALLVAALPHDARRSTPRRYYPVRIVELRARCRTPAARACTAAARAIEKTYVFTRGRRRSRSTTTAPMTHAVGDRRRAPRRRAARRSSIRARRASVVPLPSKIDHVAGAAGRPPRVPDRGRRRLGRSRSAATRPLVRPRRDVRDLVVSRRARCATTACCGRRGRGGRRSPRPPSCASACAPSAARSRRSTSGTLRAGRSGSTRRRWPRLEERSARCRSTSSSHPGFLGPRSQGRHRADYAGPQRPHGRARALRATVRSSRLPSARRSSRARGDGPGLA